MDLLTFIEEFLNEKLYLCDQTLFGHLSFVDKLKIKRFNFMYSKMSVSQDGDTSLIQS